MTTDQTPPSLADIAAAEEEECNALRARLAAGEELWLSGQATYAPGLPEIEASTFRARVELGIHGKAATFGARIVDVEVAEQAMAWGEVDGVPVLRPVDLGEVPALIQVTVQGRAVPVSS